MIKKLLLGFGALFIILLTVVLIRGALFVPPAPDKPISGNIPALPSSAMVAAHLSQSIRFETVSAQTENSSDTEFGKFTLWLTNTYPATYRVLTLHRINAHTLLIHWRGENQQLSPVLLSAHYDVVPVNPDTLTNWQHPPFSGEVDAGGTIWGRGALDDKSAVIAIAESVEAAIKQAYTPQRDVYIAFTHDEERGGELGAKGVTQWFTDHNITLGWSLDEGSFVLDGLVPGMAEPIASINIAEKGFLTLQLSASGAGGHSSMPPPQTAVTRISRAVVAVQDAPVPGGLTGVTAQMYSSIARHMSFDKRVLFANSWLFSSVIENVVGASASGNAMLRTTTAPTMLSGSVKANVLPDTATATINFRLHPRDTIEDIVEWVRDAINDEDVTISVLEAFAPSKVSPSDNEAFRLLAASAQHVYSDAVVTPGLTVAATDSHHYAAITDAYRFNPMMITNEDLAGFHGTNEHISTENMMRAVAFYSTLLRQL